MKKLLILLLVMVLGAVMVFAMSAPIHPPGAYSLEAAMSGYGVDGPAVTQDTVLAMETPVTAYPTSFQTFMANDNFLAVWPYSEYMITGVSLGHGRSCTEADYHLRC